MPRCASLDNISVAYLAERVAEVRQSTRSSEQSWGTTAADGTMATLTITWPKTDSVVTLRLPLGGLFRTADAPAFVVELAFALPALIFGDSTGAASHIARHIGSFDVAIAAGLLYAALRPERATALMPVALVLTACVLTTATFDLTDGSTSSGLEAHHLIDLVGFALLWVVAGRPLPRRRAARPSVAV